MDKKKQLEIAFRTLLIEMLESIGIDNWAPVTIDKYSKLLLKEVSIRTKIK